MIATLEGVLLKSEQSEDGWVRGELLQTGEGRQSSAVVRFSAPSDADGVLKLLNVPHMGSVTLRASVSVNKYNRLTVTVHGCDVNGYGDTE